MIKLIASDIDGTLVPDGTTDINPEIYDIINKLHDKGIHFVAASGRQWPSIEYLFTPVMKKVFYISDNGAYVGMHGRELFLHPMEDDKAFELIEAIKENPVLTTVVACPGSYYTDSDDQSFIDWITKGYKGVIEKVDDFRKLDKKIIKISAYTPHEDIYESASYLKDRFEDRLQMGYAGSMWLDATAPGVSKGEAIRVLQDSLGIKKEETMVFGDQGNDVEMLQSAYYSYAVSNAVDEAKQAARFLADSNINSGVLKTLKLLL